MNSPILSGLDWSWLVSRKPHNATWYTVIARLGRRLGSALGLALTRTSLQCNGLRSATQWALAGVASAGQWLRR